MRALTGDDWYPLKATNIYRLVPYRGYQFFLVTCCCRLTGGTPWGDLHVCEPLVSSGDWPSSPLSPHRSISGWLSRQAGSLTVIAS